MINWFKGRLVPGWSRCVLVSAALIVPTISNAALIENLTIGNPKALALGNAVTADPPGIDSMHFNPAGLARIKNREALLKLTVAQFTFSADFGSYHPDAQEQIDIWGNGQSDWVENSHSETSDVVLKIPFVDGRQEWPLPFIVAPTGGAAYRPEGTNYTLGTGAWAPVAAGYIRDEDDPGRLMGKEMALTRITYFSPTVAFKLTDDWTVGAGIHFSYNGLSAYTDLRLTHLLVGVINELFGGLDDGGCLGLPPDVTGQSVCDNYMDPFDTLVELEVDVETGLSVNAVFGALWEPAPWFTWGFVYHTEAKNRMEGTYRLGYSEGWQNIFADIRNAPGLGSLSAFLGLPTGLAEQTGDAKVEFNQPAHFATGVSVRVLPDWKVNIDAKWTDYDIWEGILIEFDQKQEFSAVASILSEYSTSDTLTIPRHYKSVWNFAIGVEHQFNDRLALRAGWEPRKSSIPDDKQGVLLPVGDANLYSLGFGYSWKRGKHFDFAVAYLHSEAKIDYGQSTNSNSMDITNNFIYNPYSGLDIETEINAYIVEASYHYEF